jgi:hypothetical protein
MLKEAFALIDTEAGDIANMANLSALIMQTFSFHWVGFYLAGRDQLLLGPFQGPVACTSRELALSLELNKDTVTRGLAKLRSCGVITMVTRGGATGASVFAISVPAGLVIDDRGADVDVVARRGKRRRRGAPHEAASRLSLLT